MLPECLAELLCMFKEIPAHIEKQTSGFRRDDPCFSAGKDRDPVFFFCLTENFTQVRLGHRQPLCGRRQRAGVGDLEEILHVLKIHLEVAPLL